ncbi:hypothetical protein K2173_009092 [Erythroxylum novogranatense]|uniref:Patellin-3 n=1 Tax=Erythroxylum novogranatense TaxID=1862640 RepID=A0AAV8TVQ7_9ROSI|nr:hypothetical protein K2173_009092 [Erythroxylum novogranatense]
MAEETSKPEAAPVPAAEVKVEKPVAETTPAPEPEPEKAAAPIQEEPVVVESDEKAKTTMTQSESFKEESNIAGELPDTEKKALDEFKRFIQEALNKHEFIPPPPPPPPAAKEEKPAGEEAAVSEEPKAEESKTETAEPAKEEEKVEVAKEEEKIELPKEKEKVDVAKEEEKIEIAKEKEKVEVAIEEEKVEAKKDEKVEAEEEAKIEIAKKEEKVEAEEEAKVEIAKEEEKVEVAKEEEKVEVAKEEEKVKVQEEAKTEPEAVVVAEEVKKKVTAVDEDGAKTVEAIEETVVAVSTAQATTEEEKPKESETAPPPAAEEAAPADPPLPPEEVSIWGIPLLADERSDVILLKFLRARDFKVKDAFAMLKNTVKWRKEFGIDALLEEDLGNGFDKFVYMHGFDKENHPVCYNVYGAFQDKELYQNCFGDEEKRVKFLRWRIQFLERSIRRLDFNPGGISTIVQVNDLKNSPGLGKKELRQVTNQALNLLQDNYPEFVAKQVFINVPWWYLAFNRVISPFLTQRTKSKFVFSSPPKSAETLFKYIAPELVPVQYGGLSREGEQEFGVSDAVTEVTIKATSKHTVDFSISEKCLLVWELRVIGNEVSYGAEFVPTAEDGYTVIVSKSRKIKADEPVISDSFKIGEAGKVVLTIDNQTSKKKKLLYRSKTKPISE